MHDTTLKKSLPSYYSARPRSWENGWLPPMDVDSLQQQSPDRSSSPFPATANLTLETGGSLCLHVDVLGDDGQGGPSMGTGGGESFLLQAHRLDAGGGEPRVWGAVVGEDGGRRRRELVALGGVLRRPVGGRALDVAAVEEADGALSLSIKERVEKGKKLVLRTTRLGPALSPGDSLGRALSGAAAQLARARGQLEEAEREKAVLRGEHEKMQEVLRMRVADKDWVQSELLAKFNMVLNAKRAKIAELQERLRSKGERGAELEEGDDRRGAGGKPEGARTASKKKRGRGRESAVSQGPTGVVGDEGEDAKEGGGSGRRPFWRRAPVRGGRGSAAGGGAGDGSHGGGEDSGGEGAEEGIWGCHTGHADVLPAPVDTTEVHGGLEELFKARRGPRSGSLITASTGDGGRGDGRLPESKGDLGEHGAGRGGRTEFLGRREAPGRSAAPRATPGVTEELARTPKKSYGLLDSDSD